MAEAPNQTVAMQQMNDEERAAFNAARQKTLQLVKTIGRPLDKPLDVNNIVADNDERRMMTVQKQFTLTLDDGRRIDFPAGVVSVPVKSLNAPIADHWYLKAHNVKPYNAPAVLRPVGSQAIPAIVEIGKDKIPQEQIATAAQATTGLTIEQWNVLPDAQREEIIMGVINFRKAYLEKYPAQEGEESDPGETAAAGGAAPAGRGAGKQKK